MQKIVPGVRSSFSILFFGLLLLASGAWGQDPEQDQAQPDPPEADLTVESIQARITALDGMPAVDEATKAQIRAILKDTLEELKSASDASSQADALEQEAAAAPAMLVQIRKELASPAPAPGVGLPPDATQAQVDQQLQQAEQALAAARDLFDQLRDEQVRRGERRTALDEQISAAAEHLGELDDALNAPSEAGPLGEARRLQLLAQRRATRQENRALTAELANYDARRELLPARIDRGSRRVTLAEQALAAWQTL